MFVRAPNPIWYLPDLIGQPLNDEYYAFFLTNTLPYLPQNVYRDPQGITVWTGDVVQFLQNGTLPNNLYFDPNLTYRIEIRHGNSQSDQLIYEINNFVPGSNGGSIGNSLAILATDNEVSNSTFAEVSFQRSLTSTQPTMTITTAGTYQIAPSWELVLVGTGSTTLTQLVYSGDQNQINNPPFALRVNNNGWTESYLRQRLNHNGAIWANGAITMSITARAQTVSEIVSLLYAPNSPGVSQTVATGLLGTGNYEVLQGAIDLPASVNNVLSTSAYVDIIIQLPPTGIVDISSVQVIGQSDPLPSDFNPLTDIPTYQQQSEERMIDHLFHIYRNSILHQPKENLLAGWNFALNPWQFRSPSSSNVANNTYTADQTIIVQQAYVNSATANNVAVSRASAANNYAFTVTAVTATNKFAIVQYIDPSTIRQYWGKTLSSLVNMLVSSPTHSSAPRIKMRLIYRSSLPSTIAQDEPISVWTNTAGSDPTFKAGWTAIAPLNDPIYTLSGSYQDFKFDQIVLPASNDVNMTLGIVIYTLDNINQAATADSILIQDVSLVNNDFAIKASTETFDQTLKKCQFYYEKSYNVEILPGAAGITNANASSVIMAANVATVYGIDRPFKSSKRADPVMVWYSPQDGTANNVYDVTFASNIPVSITDGSGKNSTGYPTCTLNLNDGDAARAHWTADSRLGI